ncbi:CBS domain-containing protein YhcV [Planobispora rosea]|uniref:CBS domain-containing protein YhcV n=1 Tax=Planobispora rosea TaxID=35762 RepID=A0A8J3S403_PLARO|nr:CBS domain-containing protein [Planobispora rosea]GGS94155.1 CBS domain-containing protein YhcV [Planobispora rosea]GIH87352.1 CBS domain-containing protein YhcV [Planobispora rosea]
MTKTVADVMTANPATIDASQPVSVAAKIMSDEDTGAVIITNDGVISGIVTDRDIAVRVVAEDKGPGTPVRDACSEDLVTVGPDTSLEQVVQLMRSKAVRRMPVVENDHAVGIISLGDLAIERDSDSALADISAAEGNR